MATELQAKLDTTFKVGPWTVRLGIESDYDSSTADADCYTPKQVAAFERGDWEYVGIVASVSLDGVKLGRSSLWGIERGYLPMTDEDDNLTADLEYVDVYDEAIESVIDEAVADAQTTLTSLVNKARTVVTS